MGKYVIDSKVFGEMTLIEEEGAYICEADWLGQTVKVVMPADAEDMIWSLAMAEEFYCDREDWDRHLRQNAADQLLEMAQEFDPSVTEEEFIRRITPKEIKVSSSDMISMVFSCGSMLGGMNLTVYAPLGE